MSERVVELPRQSPSSEFERTPPQDVAAEQSVLGGMLLSKDAIADVVEVVRATDFYRPSHQTIFDTVLDLYGRGEPADAVTVAGELTRTGDIARVGGAPYLHTLLSSVPTAANAGYYARIVAERAVLRRLVEAGTRIVQLGYAADGGEVDDLVDRAQQAIYDVTERRTSEDYTVLGDVMQPAMDEMEAISSRAGTMTGVPTGFSDLDTLTNGLHPGQLIVVAGRPGLGKALALDTPLPTTTGWTTMGAVRPGDELLGADGRPVMVLAATPVLYERPCFALTFCDGTVLVADALHEWSTAGAVAGRRGAVLTTAQIAASVRCPRTGAPQHAVRLAQALQLPEADLPLSPYVLGAWLAVGHRDAARLPLVAPELVVQLEGEDVGVVPSADGTAHELVLAGEESGVAARLHALGVLDDRHLPRAVLRSCERQRRALLAGLLDAATVAADASARGWPAAMTALVTADGRIEVAVTGERLAADLQDLLVGLGHGCSLSVAQGGGSTGEASRWVVVVRPSDDVFRLAGPEQLLKQGRAGSPRRDVRTVVDARPVASVPVRCVQVASADHLYLAGRAMVPTHNSTLGLDIARSCSIKHGMTSAIFSLEMTKTEITMRLLSAEARIGLHHMRTGTMSDDDWARLARRMGEVADAPLFIDDSPNLSMMEIRAKARRLKQRHDLKLVIVDYLQLMSGNKKAESRQQEVSELSRNLKLLAKELEVPVVAMSQLNRGPEQRTDKKPQLSDLRESGSIEQDADMVILLYREDAFEKESPRAGEADLIVAKHRNGPTQTITVASQLHYSRFVDMSTG